MSTALSRTPHLENGDRLTKQEFLLRWAASPEIKHAELLEGIVYVNAAAIRARSHGLPHYLMASWLGAYRRATPSVLVILPSTIELSEQDLPEPDVMMIIDHPAYGATSFDEDDWLYGPAELVVEISASTASKDLNLKRRVYEKAGVKEYIVWRTIETGLDWFVLSESGTYEKMSVDSADGFYKSQVYPGLWLDPEVLFSQNETLLIERLQEGIKTPEHASFVSKLKR
jgi:Uma2 family endonuclease